MSFFSNKFAIFFKTKIDKISEELIDNVGTDDDTFGSDDETTHTLNCFSPITVEEVEQVMRKLSNKTCLLDPLPTWILKQNISAVSPLVTRFVNASLHDGIFPDAFKKAIVRPVLKKTYSRCHFFFFFVGKIIDQFLIFSFSPRLLNPSLLPNSRTICLIIIYPRNFKVPTEKA